MGFTVTDSEQARADPSTTWWSMQSYEISAEKKEAHWVQLLAQEVDVITLLAQHLIKHHAKITLATERVTFACTRNGQNCVYLHNISASSTSRCDCRQDNTR
eukprot:1154832-Pelagomonas_calceolata.AAC.9